MLRRHCHHHGRFCPFGRALTAVAATLALPCSTKRTPCTCNLCKQRTFSTEVVLLHSNTRPQLRSTSTINNFVTQRAISWLGRPSHSKLKKIITKLQLGSADLCSHNLHSTATQHNKPRTNTTQHNKSQTTMRVIVTSSEGRVAVQVRPSQPVAALKAAYVASGSAPVGSEGFVCLQYRKRSRVVVACLCPASFQNVDGLTRVAKTHIHR